MEVKKQKTMQASKNGRLEQNKKKVLIKLGYINAVIAKYAFMTLKNVFVIMKVVQFAKKIFVVFAINI